METPSVAAEASWFSTRRLFHDVANISGPIANNVQDDRFCKILFRRAKSELFCFAALRIPNSLWCKGLRRRSRWRQPNRRARRKQFFAR